MDVIDFPIPKKVTTPLTGDAVQFYIAREVDPYDVHDTHLGVGKSAGYWRTAMDARLAAARFIADGHRVDKIIKVSVNGREYLEMEDREPGDVSHANVAAYLDEMNVALGLTRGAYPDAGSW